MGGPSKNRLLRDLKIYRKILCCKTDPFWRSQDDTKTFAKSFKIRSHIKRPKIGLRGDLEKIGKTWRNIEPFFGPQDGPQKKWDRPKIFKNGVQERPRPTINIFDDFCRARAGRLCWLMLQEGPRSDFGPQEGFKTAPRGPQKGFQEGPKTSFQEGFCHHFLKNSDHCMHCIELSKNMFAFIRACPFNQFQVFSDKVARDGPWSSCKPPVEHCCVKRYISI